jgi:pullulanase
MYESFGFAKQPNGQYGFQLFVPDNTIDPSQYTVGGPSNIASVAVYGDFQPAAKLSTQKWDQTKPLNMALQKHKNGLLFTAYLPVGFPNGFYQYKYIVTFKNGTTRIVGDPCTKYGGTDSDNSAFVVGGSPVSITPIQSAKPLSGEDLVLYELMIADFTAGLNSKLAPVDALVQKLPYLKNLGINAIEFMPWIAWPDSDSFSWGYDPAYFFSVEYNYVTDPAAPLEKLSRLGNMISACHRAGLMVVLDIVLQHASAGGNNPADLQNATGFPYKWLWEDPTQSPFIEPTPTPGGYPLQYANACTLQFITDVCEYWMNRFGIDGFRFDQVSGFDFPQNPCEGATALISNLKTYLAGQKKTVFPLTIEDTWDYNAVNDTNNVGATHGWFDPFRGAATAFLPYGNQPQTYYLRVLNSAYQFDFPKAPVLYLENHDHTTVTFLAGGREWWFRVQPYMIAMATCSGALLIGNGQEFGRSEFIPDSDTPTQKRVAPRPLDWSQSTDPIGEKIESVYQFLFKLRKDHAGLRSPNFYPDTYDQQWNHFGPDGYGIDVDKQVVIYHRWGNSATGQLEHFIVVLNFSGSPQTVNVPFPMNGTWSDLLNSNTTYQVTNYWLNNFNVNSYWGCIFYLQA